VTTADHFDMARFRDDVNAYVTRQGLTKTSLSRSVGGQKDLVWSFINGTRANMAVTVAAGLARECDLDLGSYVTPWVES
jgi:hypothetical protein